MGIRTLQRFSAALRSREPWYRSIVEQEPAGVTTISLDGFVHSMNQAGMTLFDAHSAQEVIGQPIATLVHAEDRQVFQQAFRKACGGQPVTLQFHAIGVRGRLRWMEMSAAPLRDAAGAILVVIGVLRDVTEQKLAVEMLWESEHRLRTLLDHAPEAIIIYDADLDQFIDANENAATLYGLSRVSLLERTFSHVSPPVQPDGHPSAPLLHERIEAVLAGKPCMFEWTHRHQCGDLIPCEVRLVRFPASRRRLIRCSITDIRARKHLEAQLRESQKLEAIGRLAGGVAHDFNNILMIINGCATLLLRAGIEGRQAIWAERIQQAGERAAALTGQLLAFSRRQVLQLKVFDLRTSVESMSKMIEPLIGTAIQMITRLSPVPCPVKADPAQVEQVILNLAVNGRDAMPQGGTLTLDVGRVTVAEATDEPIPPPGAYVALKVTDTGCGMDEETRAHLFEPFYTTKTQGAGTGLGLATVYGIVTQSGGHITVSTQRGIGTTFAVYLPLLAEPAGWSEPRLESATVMGGSETILLAEDQHGVLVTVQEMLRMGGFTVLTATDGPSALALAKTYPGPIHLLLTDMVMPGMNGCELAEALTSVRPAVKVLIISGYTGDELGRPNLNITGRRFIQKPFQAEALLGIIREMLDEAPPHDRVEDGCRPD